jgi:nitroreductase
MKLNLSADEVLTTTRTVRKRLDLDRPVERSVVEEALEVALQAPSASNRQTWHWVVVEDPATRQAVADVYARNYAGYRAMPRPTYPEGDVRAAQGPRVSESSAYLADNFARVPLLLVPCVDGRPDGAPVERQAALWASLLPAVWSFLLALRERGLGSAWTTIHLMNGGEREVADILGIPYDRVTQAGLFPIAYTKGTDFKPVERRPLGEVLHWGAW